MGNFLNTLPELGDSLWRIIMVNGAVKLATASSPAIDALKKLEAAGVSILVCGTCLEFFQLMDQKAVGQVTNMLDVVTSQQLADKVITL
jgi:selenium metabolism protein YedF